MKKSYHLFLLLALLTIFYYYLWQGHSPLNGNQSGILPWIWLLVALPLVITWQLYNFNRNGTRSTNLLVIHLVLVAATTLILPWLFNESLIRYPRIYISPAADGTFWEDLSHAPAFLFIQFFVNCISILFLFFNRRLSERLRNSENPTT